MKTIDEFGISKTPWEVVRVTRQKEAVIKASDNAIVATMHADNASLVAAAPELLAFAVAYYNASEKNSVKINHNNGDKYQSGLMLMCKDALVKAGIMDKSEVWQEEVK